MASGSAAKGKDLYKILGVQNDADDATIKKAYRKIALVNHPDKKPGDTEAESIFKEATAAYEVLSDAAQRKKYDAGEIDADELLANMGVGLTAVMALFARLSGLSMQMPLSEEVTNQVAAGGVESSAAFILPSVPVSRRVIKGHQGNG